MGQHRAEACGTCAFDHGLLDLEQQRHRLFQIALGHEQDIVDQFADEPDIDRPRHLDRDALRQGIAGGGQRGALHQIVHRRIELGLDPDHVDIAHRLGDGGAARDQAAAADRDDQCVDLRRILQHLERDGALAGDDLRIVERVDDRQPLCVGQIARIGQRLVDIVAVEDDLGAVPAGLGDLHRRRMRRHHDRHRDAEPRAMISEALGVIACRCRDHAPRPRFGGQLQQFVERTALLVGGSELEILELDVDGRTGELAQGPADQGRRPHNRRRHPRMRGADVVERHGERGISAGFQKRSHPSRLGPSQWFLNPRGLLARSREDRDCAEPRPTALWRGALPGRIGLSLWQRSAFSALA